MVDYQDRYRKAIAFALQADAEVKRLRRELAEEKEARAAMTIVAEEALAALESLGAHNQA